MDFYTFCTDGNRNECSERSYKILYNFTLTVSPHYLIYIIYSLFYVRLSHILYKFWNDTMRGHDLAYRQTDRVNVLEKLWHDGWKLTAWTHCHLRLYNVTTLKPQRQQSLLHTAAAAASIGVDRESQGNNSSIRGLRAQDLQGTKNRIKSRNGN